MTQGVLEVVAFDRKLRTVLAAIPLRVELGRPPAPETGEKVPKIPYAVIYPIEGGSFDGPPLASPDSCAQLIRQVTTVGETAEQALLVMDRVRRTLLGRTSGVFTVSLDTPSVKVAGRWSLGPGGADADLRLHEVAERFVFYCEAA